jgi:hypothetical protein
MRTSTSVVLVVAGAIMALAITSQPDFIDLHVAGVILVITGAFGLWPRGGRALFRLSRVRLRRILDQTPPVEGTRVPLEELLGPGAPDVWPPWRGHQELVRAPLSRPEVIGSDQADASAEAHERR